MPVKKKEKPVSRSERLRKEGLIIPPKPELKEDYVEDYIVHELESIKLYLFDIVKRLDKLESHYVPPMVASYLPTPGENPFDRNAMYKGPNAGKGQDFVRKNVAMILKNMLPPATLALMPEEVRKAYHNILSVMGAPNDPVWEKEIPRDPREPVPTDTFKNVSDLWNNVANNLKKLEGVNLSDEIAKAAEDVFGIDEEKHPFTEEQMDFVKGLYVGTKKEDETEAKEEQSSDQSSQKDQDDSTTSRSKESDK